MNKITVQTVDANGSKIEESKLTVDNNEILQVIIPDNMSREQALHMHNMVKNALEENRNVMTIPENIHFQVLKIG